MMDVKDAYSMAEKYVNDPGLEAAWATVIILIWKTEADFGILKRTVIFDGSLKFFAIMSIRAYENAQTHFNILRSVDPQDLKLTSGYDDKIYAAFRQQFSSLQIDVINEDELKSETSKREWRSFCEMVKEWIDDHDFGTLLRLNTLGAYDSDNTILVPRFQFLTIEIARNREGCNVAVREKFRNLLENADFTKETNR